MHKCTEKNIDELLPYINNSRTHSPEQVNQIASSIKEFGFTNPVLIDESNMIIAGHGRLLASQKLCLKNIPCIVLSGLSEAQKKAYVIADNKLALNAGWDEAMLANEIAQLQELDFNIDLLGFSADEINAIVEAHAEPIDGLTDADDCPEPPIEPVTIDGDIWYLGNHRLMCGDSTDAGSVALLMGGRLADMLITDPPYNVAYEGGTKEKLKIKNDSMSNDAFREFLKLAFLSADSVMKQGAVFYIWHADSEGYYFRGACFDVGFKVRQCLIWNKNQIVMGRQDYHWKHEPCLYGWKDGASHLWASDRKQSTVINFNKPQRNGEHPTMKPVDLIEYQILNNTKGQDAVLDLFGGSGTTIIACEKNNRHGYLMELDTKYCDVIIKRWQDFTGKEAVLEATNKTYKEVKNDRKP